ncbi:MAG: hypothetical protein K8R58_01060, partial [Bacteroidales bacterium]|nr:hypothetical protein [Bacteroidales bacterium]
SIPKEIGNCSMLSLLYIGKNQIQELPVEMGNLSHLTELDVAYTGVMLPLPESLCSIRGLEYLYVDKNTIVPYCLQGNRNPRFHIMLK